MASPIKVFNFLLKENTLNDLDKLDYINSLWNENLKLLENSLNGFEQLSFHTLTFNHKWLAEKEVFHYKRFLEKYLKLLKRDVKNLNYFYSFEFTGETHLHIHLVVNADFSLDKKKEIRKKWNEWQNWKFYNEKGLVILSNNSIFGVSSFDLKNVSKYLTKNLLNVDEKLCKLYYILFPFKIMSGGGSFFFQEQKFEIARIMRNLMNALELKLMNFFEIPLSESIFKKEGKTIKEYYDKWDIVFRKTVDEDFIKLEKTLKSLDRNSKEDELEIAQKQLDSFMKKGKEVINVFNLYNFEFEDFFKEFESQIQKEKKSLLFELFSDLLDLKTIFVYILDALAQTLLKSKYQHELLEKEDSYFLKDLLQDKNINKDILESRFKYYFHKVYEYNLFKCLLINNIVQFAKSTKKKKHCRFYIYLSAFIEDKNFKSLKEFCMELFTFYQVFKEREKKHINRRAALEYADTCGLFYRKGLLEQLSIFFNDILNALYHIKFFIKVDKTSTQELNFFRLPKEVLKKLLNYKYISYIQWPQVKFPGLLKKGDLVNRNKNFVTNVSSSKMKIINKLQQISFKINKNYLEFLFDLSPGELYKFFPSVNFSSFDERYEKKEGKRKRKVKYYFSSIEYFICLEFLMQLRLATLLCKIPLWFLRFMDNRHRLYIRNYPLHFDGNAFLRPLFIFNNSIPVFFKDRLKHFPFFYNYLKNPKTEGYIKHDFFKNPYDTLIGFDASSQVFQILGALILDERMLKLTKVLKVEDSQENLKVGFYEFLLREFWLKCGDFALVKEELQKAFETMKNKPSELVTLAFYEVDLRFQKLLEKIDRKWVKSTLMTYGYNKSILTLTYDTVDYLFENEGCLNRFTIYFYRKIASYLTTNLIKCLDENFKSLSSLRALFRALVSLGCFLQVGNFINLNDNLGFKFQEDFVLQNYKASEEIKIQKWIRYTQHEREIHGGRKGRNLTDKFYINTLEKDRKMDIRKSQNALLPNTTHHIDSNLMFFTLEFLFKGKIPVIAIHDSFYVNHIFSKEVKNAYVDSFIKIFSKDILYILIRNNLFMWQLSEKSKDFINNSIILQEYCEFMKKLSIDFTSLDLNKFLNCDESFKKTLSGSQKEILKKCEKIAKLYFLIKSQNSFDNSTFASLLEKSFNDNILS